MGTLDDGTFAGDSLRFNVSTFQFSGHRVADSLKFGMVFGRDTIPEMSLRFASASTASIWTFPRP